MSGPPSFDPSQLTPIPGLRPGGLHPGGLSAALHQNPMQRQHQQQRLAALEYERKLADMENRTVRPHYLDDEAWVEFLARSNAKWREEHARAVEWWLRSPSLAVTGQDGGAKGYQDGADDGDHKKLLGVLGSVRRAQGCSAIIMGHSCSLSDVGDVVAIEWANAKARRNFFASSEASTSFTQAMQQANFQRFLAYEQLDQSYLGIIDYAVHAATPIHEIWTACFPADLSTDDMGIIEKREGPVQLPRDTCRNRRPVPKAQEILYGACMRSHGWALVEDGVTEHCQNRPVRRMVYVFPWASEEARRLYRDEAIWRTTTRHGRVLDRPTDGFLYELEELGMLGFERWDYRLDESVSIK